MIVACGLGMFMQRARTRVEADPSIGFEGSRLPRSDCRQCCDHSALFQYLLDEGMIDQPLLLRGIESQMPRIAFARDVFDDLEALRLRVRTGLRNDASDLAFCFGGAFEPDGPMGFLVLLRKLVEAIEALAQGRIDVRRLPE